MGLQLNNLLVLLKMLNNQHKYLLIILRCVPVPAILNTLSISKFLHFCIVFHLTKLHLFFVRSLASVTDAPIKEHAKQFSYYKPITYHKSSALLDSVICGYQNHTVLVSPGPQSEKQKNREHLRESRPTINPSWGQVGRMN